MAFPGAIASIAFHEWLAQYPDIAEQLARDMGASVFNGFSFILGFLIVFRTQKAYQRWWEGGTLLSELRGEWFNACSNLVAFLNMDPSKETEVMEMQHKLVRLFSLLYGCALRQVSMSPVNNNLEFINLAGFDARSLQYMGDCHDACEIVLQWLQRLIVEANTKDVIKIAPPILARVYNQLGQGIVKLNDARKIKEFPVPFALAQLIAMMLLLHWFSTTLLCALAVSHPALAGLAAFIVVFSFWGVNYIAVELENPYGADANDLPLLEMQDNLNRSLLCMLSTKATRPPDFEFIFERDTDVKNITRRFKMDDYLKELKESLEGSRTRT